MVLCLNKHNQLFKLFLNLFYPYLRLISLHLDKLLVLPLTTPINLLLHPPPLKNRDFFVEMSLWFFGGLQLSSRDPVMTFPFPNHCVSLFFQFVQRRVWLDDDIQIRRTANTFFFILESFLIIFQPCVLALCGILCCFIPMKKSH